MKPMESLHLRLLTAVTPLLILPVAVPASLLFLQESVLAQDARVVQATDVAARLAEADRLLQQGTQQFQVSQFQEALSSLQGALELYQDPVVRSVFPEKSRKGEAFALDGLANTYMSLGEYQQAISLHEQSLFISRELEDRQGEAISLANLGRLYRDIGNSVQAIDRFEQSLLIIRELDNQHLESYVQINLGAAYMDLGLYLQTVETFEQNITIFRELDDRFAEGRSLRALGTVYRVLGQYQQAIDFYEQSLAITRELGDRQGEANVLGSLGDAHVNTRQYMQAINFYEQSLIITRELGDRLQEAIVLNNLGIAYTNLEQYQQAITFQEQALTITDEIGSRQVEGNVLGSLGNSYRGLGQYQQAIELYEQRLAIAREVDDRQGEGIALNNLGSIYYSLRQFFASTDAYLNAIAIYDTLRTADLPDAEKIAFFDTYLQTYLNLQRSLVAQNEPEQALVYAERGRARAFVELLATRITNNGNFNATSLESISSPDLPEIQRIAREQNATLVNYSVVSDRSLFIWVIQPTGEIAFQQVELGDRNLSELVSLVREAIGVRGPDTADAIISLTPQALEQQQSQRRQQLQELHQLLIEPIAQSLPTDPTQRVIFIPHQDLFLVPFAALIDGNGDYLIEHHTILTAPSIQVLDLTHQQAIANHTQSDRPTHPLIVGNPIMPSVWNPQTNQTRQLSSLPGAEREAIAIAEALNTEALLWDNANKATVMAQMPNARIIHLATHGLLEYGSPQDSGVLDVPGAIALAPSVSESGLLTAAEILQMDLNADLVVLSACDTGRGRITGDGVIGLSRAFVTAGVPSLMVSLWAVDDAATAEWMVTFYDQWQQTGDKAQAARQAMLTTMENHPDPRLWAAFTLIGSAQ